MNRRIDAQHGEYADVYARCDDTNRRLCNQAFFTRIYLQADAEAWGALP